MLMRSQIKASKCKKNIFLEFPQLEVLTLSDKGRSAKQHRKTSNNTSSLVLDNIYRSVSSTAT